MPEPGQLRGVYNIVEAGEYDTVPDQMSVETFQRELDDGYTPEAVTVVNLENAYSDESFIRTLSRTMDRRADDLANADPNPMIQFLVEADIHRGDTAFDLFYDGEIYSLQKVFGRQLKSRADDHSWLTTPF